MRGRLLRSSLLTPVLIGLLASVSQADVQWSFRFSPTGLGLTQTQVIRLGGGAWNGEDLRVAGMRMTGADVDAFSLDPDLTGATIPFGTYRDSLLHFAPRHLGASSAILTINETPNPPFEPIVVTLSGWCSALDSLELDQQMIAGGESGTSANLTIKLTGPGPYGPGWDPAEIGRDLNLHSVRIQSSKPEVIAPIDVDVSGKSTVTIPVTASAVNNVTEVVITATYGGVTKTAKVIVAPPPFGEPPVANLPGNVPSTPGQQGAESRGDLVRLTPWGRMRYIGESPEGSVFKQQILIENTSPYPIERVKYYGYWKGALNSNTDWTAPFNHILNAKGYCTPPGIVSNACDKILMDFKWVRGRNPGPVAIGHKLQPLKIEIMGTLRSDPGLGKPYKQTTTVMVEAPFWSHFE